MMRSSCDTQLGDQSIHQLLDHTNHSS